MKRPLANGLPRHDGERQSHQDYLTGPLDGSCKTGSSTIARSPGPPDPESSSCSVSS